MNLHYLKDFYNNVPVEYIIKEKYAILEDNEYVARFGLKNIKDIANIPINEPMKYSESTLIKAIRYGMIFLISYKGEKDSHFAGHERVIYPMVLGRSAKGKPLLRGWHLNGWSVSNSRHINKIWRMFRTDRILSMTFTGSFYRLPPSGYNANDRGMRGGIIVRADFNEIRKNQQTLVNQQKIQNKKEIELKPSSPYRQFVTILVKNTNSQLDLTKALDNPYINNIKDLAGSRVTFCKGLYGAHYLAILGAVGQSGDTVKIKDNEGRLIGIYKILDSATGEMLKKVKNIKGNKVYDLYIFEKKLD
jgi:hypothetical protein